VLIGVNPWLKYFQNEVEILNFQDRFYILLEMRLSGVAEQEYTRLYGKSQLSVNRVYPGGRAWL